MHRTQRTGRIDRSAHTAAVDFYRNRATAWRGAARRDAAAALTVVSALLLVLAGTLAIVLLVSAAQPSKPSSHAMLMRTTPLR